MNNELYHYGVLGMKWGHRKASRTLNKKLRKSFKALDAYAKSISLVGSVTIYDAKNRKTMKRPVKRSILIWMNLTNWVTTGVTIVIMERLGD